MTRKAIWLTWENQRRNRELSGAFKIPLYEFTEIDKIENYLKKYIVGFAKTICTLRITKPRIVVCQNPSIVLALLVIVLKPLIGIRVVIDAHNAGLFPLNGRSKLLNIASRFIQYNADLTIVSNEMLKKHVEKNGGRAFVLQDKIPELKGKRTRKLRGKYNILFICTYSSDEPYEIVFKAAKLINKEIVIYVSGNFNKKEINHYEVPENVVLTGFLTENEYVAMLNSVDATIDLTNRENCLVCGAYESTAVGKPMILSKTRALMEYFNQGAIFVNHTADGIANGIEEFIKRNKELSEQIRYLKECRTIDWQKRRIELEKILK